MLRFYPYYTKNHPFLISKTVFANSIYNHRTTKTNQKYPSVNL